MIAGIRHAIIIPNNSNTRSLYRIIMAENICTSKVCFSVGSFNHISFTDCHRFTSFHGSTIANGYCRIIIRRCVR